MKLINLKHVLMVVLAGLLIACSTVPTPHNGKIPLKVALIISDDFRNKVKIDSIFCKCKVKCAGLLGNGKCISKNGYVNSKSNIGFVSEEIFSKGVKSYFEQADLYQSIDSIKNEDAYDLMLVPSVDYSTSYDKEAALKIGVQFGEHDYFDLAANVTVGLQVINSKDGFIKNLTASGYSIRNSGSAYYCSDDNVGYFSPFYGPIRSAMDSAIGDLFNDVETEMIPFTLAKSQKLALPSELSLTTKFTDSGSLLPNTTLDAAEEAEIVVSITNTGKGTGYGTNLEISADNQKIAFDKNITVGDIQAGGMKEIRIKVKAGLDITDGETPFTFNLKEKRGYDARKVVYPLRTARMLKPQLEIMSTEINDGDSGLAKGNGNGIPESGETVEVVAYIKNSGEGKAVGVDLKGADLSPGLRWVRSETSLGTIPPGETVKGKLAFEIPRNFDGNEITSNMQVSDVRGVGGGDRKLALAYGKKSPNIEYAWRIFSNGEDVKSITNGGDYEVELTLANRGGIAARNVAVSLSAGTGVALSRSKLDVGEIKEGTALPCTRFKLSLPRTYADYRTTVGIDISQADFPAMNRIISIPVEVKAPKISYTAQLRSKGGGNTIEQGERADLYLQVVNEGSLPAEGVKVKIESRDENLRIVGKSEELIGGVKPGNAGEGIKFTLNATRRLKAGENQIAVQISQNEFPQVKMNYALVIREEGAEVIRVTAEDAERHDLVTRLRKTGGPEIRFKGAVTETAEETCRVAFEVSDQASNIAPDSIRVTVNGTAIPLGEEAGLSAKPERLKQVVVSVPLKGGENRVMVTARNADYASVREELVINLKSDDDMELPPVTGMRNPDAVAVVIGISKYKNLPSVDFARRDAETVKNYLVRSLGYETNRIIELYDGDADRTSLVTALYDDLRDRVKPGVSDVFIYYSGHGMPDVDAKEAVKDAYLAPYDYRDKSTKRTGIALKELYEQLKNLDANSVTLVMDTCFSGSTEKGSLIKGVSSAVLEVSNPMLKVKNGVQFSASSSKEVARWYDKKRHGLFTYYFLQGLRGKADTNGDGVITKKELEDYVNRNVAEQSQHRQNPTSTGSPGAVMVRLK